MILQWISFLFVSCILPLWAKRYRPGRCRFQNRRIRHCTAPTPLNCSTVFSDAETRHRFCIEALSVVYRHKMHSNCCGTDPYAVDFKIDDFTTARHYCSKTVFSLENAFITAQKTSHLDKYLVLNEDSRSLVIKMILDLNWEIWNFYVESGCKDISGFSTLPLQEKPDIFLFGSNERWLKHFYPVSRFLTWAIFEVEFKIHGFRRISHCERNWKSPSRSMVICLPWAKPRLFWRTCGARPPKLSELDKK